MSRKVPFSVGIHVPPLRAYWGLTFPFDEGGFYNLTEYHRHFPFILWPMDFILSSSSIVNNQWRGRYRWKHLHVERECPDTRHTQKRMPVQWSGLEAVYKSNTYKWRIRGDHLWLDALPIYASARDYTLIPIGQQFEEAERYQKLISLPFKHNSFLF